MYLTQHGFFSSIPYQKWKCPYPDRRLCDTVEKDKDESPKYLFTKAALFATMKILYSFIE